MRFDKEDSIWKKIDKSRGESRHIDRWNETMYALDQRPFRKSTSGKEGKKTTTVSIETTDDSNDVENGAEKRDILSDIDDRAPPVTRDGKSASGDVSRPPAAIPSREVRKSARRSEENMEIEAKGGAPRGVEGKENAAGRTKTRPTRNKNNGHIPFSKKNN